MNMENSNNGIYLLSAACFFFSASLIRLQVVIGDFVRFLCSFNWVNCAFTFHILYHETHDTQQKQLRTRVQTSPDVDICKWRE